ncbi:MAG: hypothetical protein WCP52_11765 [Bacteroidota bacterium]
MENQFEKFKKEIRNEIVSADRAFDFQLTKEFLDWFINAGTFFSETHLDIPQETIVTNTTVGNCFHNSQLVSLQNEGILYFEGIIRGATSGKLIHHGFNLLDKKILDVSHLSNKENFLEELKDKTFFYFGIAFENDFIKKNPDVLTVKYLNNPFILKYYQESITL